MTARCLPIEDFTEADLRVVDVFALFLRIAPPPRTRNETADEYLAKIGVERWTAWTWLCRNDPGLRSYIAGGDWL